MVYRMYLLFECAPFLFQSTEFYDNPYDLNCDILCRVSDESITLEQIHQIYYTALEKGYDEVVNWIQNVVNRRFYCCKHYDPRFTTNDRDNIDVNDVLKSLHDKSNKSDVQVVKKSKHVSFVKKMRALFSSTPKTMEELAPEQTVEQKQEIRFMTTKEAMEENVTRTPYSTDPVEETFFDITNEDKEECPLCHFLLTPKVDTDGGLNCNKCQHSFQDGLKFISCIKTSSEIHIPVDYQYCIFCNNSLKKKGAGRYQCCRNHTYQRSLRLGQ